MRFDITKNTVLKQLRHEAHYPTYISDVQLERDLYKALDDSSKVFYAKLRNLRVFRITIPRRKTVYAVGRPCQKGEKYSMQIISIKSVRAYYSSESYMYYTPRWGAKRQYKKDVYNVQTY